MSLRILIAESENNYRHFLSQLIEKQGDLTVVGETADASDVLPLTQNLKPDVILMDLNLHGGSFEAARIVRAQIPDVRIIILSLLGGQQFEHAATHSGADMFMLKDAPIAIILAAVRTHPSKEVA